MQIVTADARRVSTTPNGTMTTLASPTQGGSRATMWLVEMNPDAEGPVHAFAEEVLWSFTTGTASVRIGDSPALTCVAGDTIVLPAGELRQLTAGPDGFTAVAASPAPSEVTRGGGESAGIPPWVA